MLQVNVHAPPAHLAVAFAMDVLHATAVPHMPFDWQVSTPLPEHCVGPGVHTPVHDPLTHAWSEHAVAFCHVPVDAAGLRLLSVAVPA